MKMRRLSTRQPGFDAKLASCTCPDFEKSELSSCKHIERVRMWYQRQSKRPTGPVLSVWWRPCEWSILVPDPLREIRCDAVEAPLPPELRPLFDDDGYLRTPLEELVALVPVLPPATAEDMSLGLAVVLPAAQALAVLPRPSETM